jgi:hypothetical protein
MDLDTERWVMQKNSSFVGVAVVSYHDTLAFAGQFSRGNTCAGDRDVDHVLAEIKCYFESTPSLAEAETPMLAEGSPLHVSLADQATLLLHTHDASAASAA